ncbi:MAG: hypothetical protein JXB35_17455, partial [Anaerolineae bacterium]|nr:hypothetical protein [Anaerolineae bacterium]
SVGRIALKLTGPADWLAPFQEAWRPWESTGSGWNVRLVADPALETPDGAYFEARPHFSDGVCHLDTRGFTGSIDPETSSAVLRAHPTASPGDLAYFIRTAFALSAFAQDTLLFHAAGIVHRDETYALFGRSGSGKSTASRLSADKPVLNDDLVLLDQNDIQWLAWATPFGRRRSPEVLSAPLRALLRLVQASDDRLEAMPEGQALGDLVANSPVVNADVSSLPELMQRWSEILRAIPVYYLHFRKATTFWEVIDAHFE